MKENFVKVILSLALVLFYYPAVSAVAESAFELEEIVVTARKREENIQDTALSISALSEADVADRFAVDIRDLAADSPSLLIDDLQQGPGSPTAIFIRGIGVSDVEKNFDPTTGVYLDGVFIGANSGAMLKVIDLERVEILRGPQGTLFGRNTVAGVIHLTRSKPTGETGGKVRISFGDYDTTNVEGVFNFALSDNAAGKVSLTRREQAEGFLTNLVDNQDLGRSEYTQATFNVLFNPQDDLEIEVTHTIEEQDQDAHTALNLGGATTWWCAVYSQCSPGIGIPQSGDRYQVYNDEANRRNASFDSDTSIVELRWDISDTMKFDYILGHKTTDEEVYQDWDGTPLPLYHTSRPASYEQTSHEFRVTSDLDGPYNYVAGVYKWDSEYRIDLVSFIGFYDLFGVIPTTDPLTVIPIYATTQQETDSIAYFFELDYQLNDNLTLTVGGRSIDEEKRSQACDGGYPACPNLKTDANADWTKFTPKAALKYQVNPDVMIYALYSQGYRSGGFNGRWGSLNSATVPYGPETVTNTEFGIKTTLRDNRIHFNFTVFSMDYEDKQIDVDVVDASAALGRSTVAANVAEATFRGVEIELHALVTENFSIDANLGSLHAEFGEFFADFTGSGVDADYSYLEPLRAPQLTWTLGGTYSFPSIPRGEAYVRASAHFIGEHHVSQLNTPTTFNEEQTLVDVSINRKIDNTKISVFGRNLTNEDGFTVGYDVFAGAAWSYAMARAPRTWGVELTHSF
ncbi:MAG: TonB-dependent receptor [SAR86 cluster bacterium]|jgi:iron complex outermembrane receptor protein|nr:TonB-dependent receptor [SAR86 cluster bacterium]